MYRNRKETGFSLTEMMIVISILLVLAAIAYPTYLLFARRAKATEALEQLGEIRIMQISYKSLEDTYIILPPNPPGPVPAIAQPWGDPGGNWEELGFRMDGVVRYQYSAVIGATGSIVTSVKMMAQSDLDSEGAPFDTWELDIKGQVAHTDRYK